MIIYLPELGEAYNNDRLLHWVGELKPNEFIVPDVWMEGHMTAAQAKYRKQFKYPKETKHFADEFHGGKSVKVKKLLKYE